MAELLMVKDGHLGGYVHGGDAGTWCPKLWTWAIEQFDAHSVLDVGCGEGQSTRYFLEAGCEALGVDGCQQAIDDSVVPGHVVQHDFCSGPFIPDQPIDLIWSCEFLEHVEEQYLANILCTFARARKGILVTHAFPGQRGHHHVNLRRSSYWIRHIEALGFYCDPYLTRQARMVTLADYPSVNHFARSGLVFHRLPQPVATGNVLTRLGRTLHTECRALSIHYGFRWSAPLREHKRRRRAAKRVAGR